MSETARSRIRVWSASPIPPGGSGNGGSGGAGIGRQGGEAWVLHWPAYCKVIQALPVPALQTEQAVHLIVEEATDAGGAHAGCLRFQVEHLPDQAAFPEQPAIAPRCIHQP